MYDRLHCHASAAPAYSKATSMPRSRAASFSSIKYSQPLSARAPQHYTTLEKSPSSDRDRQTRPRGPSSVIIKSLGEKE